MKSQELVDLRKVRELFNFGDHIDTESLVRFYPVLRETERVLLGLGAEFNITRTEITRMKINFADWFRVREGKDINEQIRKKTIS